MTDSEVKLVQRDVIEMAKLMGEWVENTDKTTPWLESVSAFKAALHSFVRALDQRLANRDRDAILAIEESQRQLSKLYAKWMECIGHRT